MIRAFWQIHSWLLCFGLVIFMSEGGGQSPDTSSPALTRRIESSSVFRLQEKWFLFHTPFPGWELGPVSGVAVGRDGSVYLIQRGSRADPILVFDRHGNLIRSWGKGDFTLPHSLRLDPQGNVWAVDAGASVLIKYSAIGKKLLTINIGQVPKVDNPFRGATDVAFAPNGHLFISDGYANARILEYTEKGKRLGEWGYSGSKPAEFQLPHAIQVSRAGTLYVADRENGRIEKFDPHGKFLGAIDQLGRCYALKLVNQTLWVSMSPFEDDPGAPGWLVQLDARNGKVLGHLDLREQRVGHAIDVSPSGEVFITAGNGLLVFTKR